MKACDYNFDGGFRPCFALDLINCLCYILFGFLLINLNEEREYEKWMDLSAVEIF